MLAMPPKLLKGEQKVSTPEDVHPSFYPESGERSSCGVQDAYP